MADADLDSSLFGISLDSDTEETPSSTSGGGGSCKTTAEEPKARTAQSEEAFQAVKAGYKVKVENGEIWKTIKLPLGPQVAKPEAQAMLHAVEELYFFKRYEEGAQFARKVLDDDDADGGLDNATRKLLRHYKYKCDGKAQIDET